MSSHELPKLSETNPDLESSASAAKSKKSAKKMKMQAKALNFWDSVQTKGANKVIQEDKFRAELKVLRTKVGMDVVSDYVFGNPNDKIDEFLVERADIVDKYEGKAAASSIDDQGNYVYSDEELQEIEFIKTAQS